MIKRYLLIGVVSIAGLLIVAAIIAATPTTGERRNSPLISNSSAGAENAVPAANAAQNRAGQLKSSKAELDVQGMSCSGCIYQIKAGLADIQGISDVLVDVSSGRVEVFYDSTRVKDPAKIAAAITDVGYPATLKRTMTRNEIQKENNHFASRSKLYIAAVGDWEISRADFDSELSHARSRYEKAYGQGVFAGAQGDALMQRLQSQIASNLISEGIQMQEVRKSGFKVPAESVEAEFSQYLTRKGITRQEFKNALRDSGYDYDYFYKKFENRLTIDQYLNDTVLSGLSNDLDKRQHYSDWFNNARLLAKVVYYDKNIESAVKTSSAGGGCGNTCSTQKQ